MRSFMICTPFYSSIITNGKGTKTNTCNTLVKNPEGKRSFEGPRLK
jgi:hypothetical protein